MTGKVATWVSTPPPDYNALNDDEPKDSRLILFASNAKIRLVQFGRITLQFDTYFFDKIPCTKSKKGYREIDYTTFWQDAETKCTGISKAKGCYIFGLSMAGGLRPYYVGQAKKSFWQEVFSLHKLNIFHSCINDKSGTPVLILICAITNKGKFATGNLDNVIDWTETILISSALERNPNIKNSQKTKYWRDVIIPGILNTPQGKNTKDSGALKRMFYGTKRKCKI